MRIETTRELPTHRDEPSITVTLLSHLYFRFVSIQILDFFQPVECFPYDQRAGPV